MESHQSLLTKSQQFLLLFLLAALFPSPALAWRSSDANEHTFNIEDFGAVGDGQTNCTDAFLSAIRAAQSAHGCSSIYVPGGRFLTWPLFLEDCLNTWILVKGVILAPAAPEAWHNSSFLIQFSSPTNCSIQGVGGAGAIDGAGHGWWRSSSSGLLGVNQPSLVVFSGVMGGYPQPGVRNVSLRNAPRTHVLITDTVMYAGVEIDQVNMESLDPGIVNGIVAINSSFLLHASVIDVGGTNLLAATEYGDSSRVYFGASDVMLRTGRGIVVSVTDGIVANVSLFDVSFQNTTYGLSVLGSRDGSGVFEISDLMQLQMAGVGVPLVLDNTVCPDDHHGCTKPARGVSIDVVLVDSFATQTSGVAGSFLCTRASQCYIALQNVTIHPVSKSGTNVFHCHNIDGTASDSDIPHGCLKPS